MIVKVQNRTMLINCEGSMELPLRHEKSVIKYYGEEIIILKTYETENEAKKVIRDIREAYKKGVQEYVL